MTTSVEALNKLTKWRSVLTGWILGTRNIADSQSQGMRDLQEARLILRAEVTALTSLMIEKQVFTLNEWDRAVAIEALAYDQMLEQRFPGFKTDQMGINIDVAAAQKTFTKYNFPP